ncbi:hypothetical protein O6H91_08G100300 [Diphasiastrum complanatum]|uniref:Uncharacterized protein n=1 Tax=Diphasiastrum complanatum TaxID=34168 RepID=A0ACC2D081_DIPCM|nr:hypothetical protein O6H91_08G100300 [Diphasiastrum complanatum]
MEVKNRSMDSVSTYMSQSSSPRIGAMSEDQNSIKSDDLGASLKVKLMCSYGGRIMPRPHDNQLRYVGGETRILVVLRSISFVDLMSKLGRLCGKAVVAKYQLPNEDLDVLVSIICDEDLDNMMEEFDRLESRDASCRLRLFLFPAKEQNAADALEDSRNAEQRFLDAVNGLASTSKRQSSATAATHMPDFLFGLDALATHDHNPAVLPLIVSDSHQTTFQILEKTVPEQQPALPIDPSTIAQPLTVSLPLDETVKEKQFLKESTEKPMISVLESTTPKEPTSQISPSTRIPESNQPASTYVPLVEISRDELPKGMVLRQYSVESSHQDFLELPVPKDTSNISNAFGLSVSQNQTAAMSDSKDSKLLSAIEEIESNLSNLSHEYTEVSKQSLDGSLAQAEEIVDEHKPEDEYQVLLNVSHPQSASDLTDKRKTAEFQDESGGQQSRIVLPGQDRVLEKQDVEFNKPRPKFEDSQNVTFQKPPNWQASSEQQQPELHLSGEGHQNDDNVFKQSQEGYQAEGTIFMQRRASDPAGQPHYYQQNLPTHFVSSNRSNATAFWQAEDKQQQFYEGVKLVPQTPGFLPRPGLTPVPAESILRVASAPNAVRMSDNFAPNYVAPPPHSAQVQRQYIPNIIYPDQQLSVTQQQIKVVPFRDQTASQSPHGTQLPSRFREQLSSGFQEHMVPAEERPPRPVQQSFRQQFAYQVDPVVDPGSHVLYDPSMPQVHYVENSSKVPPQYKVISPFEDLPMPLHDATLLPLQEIFTEAQLTPIEGWQHVPQPVMRN